jgi:hypothetical protein
VPQATYRKKLSNPLENGNNQSLNGAHAEFQRCSFVWDAITVGAILFLAKAPRMITIVCRFLWIPGLVEYHRFLM